MNPDQLTDTRVKQQIGALVVDSIALKVNLEAEQAAHAETRAELEKAAARIAELEPKLAGATGL